MWFETGGEGTAAGGLRVAVEEHEEEWGRVHGSVVAAVRYLAEVGQFAVADFVDDTARLFTSVCVVPCALRRCERCERVCGEFRPVGQCEVGGEEGVAAEEGEEPGNSGTGNAQFLAVRTDGGYPQHCQVGQTAGACRGQSGG